MIPYRSRLFRAPDHVDDAIPVATAVTSRDHALRCVWGGDGVLRYGAEPIPIRVCTARPYVIEDPEGGSAAIRRWTIEVKVDDAQKHPGVKSEQIVMAWFPYSFDWEDWTELKGHRNRSWSEVRLQLASVYRGEIEFEEFLRRRKFRDVQESNSRVLTAYFVDPKKGDSAAFSGRRTRIKGAWCANGRESLELLAFGVCGDFESDTESLLRDEQVLKVFSAVDEWIFYRYWRHHPLCAPRRLREKLLDSDLLADILRGSIRKAIAGPIRRQLSFLGYPVSVWVITVFLGALYDLNRRVAEPTRVPSSTPDLPSGTPQPEERGFQEQFAAVIQYLSSTPEVRQDPQGLAASAASRLTAVDPNDQIAALSLMAALGEFHPRTDDLLRLVLEKRSSYVEQSVQDAAERAVKLLGDS